MEGYAAGKASSGEGVGGDTPPTGGGGGGFTPKKMFINQPLYPVF